MRTDLGTLELGQLLVRAEQSLHRFDALCALESREGI